MTEFVLCVDVGNSRTKVGLFRIDAGSEPLTLLPECLWAVAVPQAEAVPWDTFRQNSPIGAGRAIRGVVAGANPAGVARVLDYWPVDWPVPALIEDVSRIPLVIRLAAPEKIGVDRLLNAVACDLIRPRGRPAVIVDTGTATTVDAVASDGAFEGGAILPGFELCARALHEYTALLPLITIDELSEEPHEPLGRNTLEALRSGLFWGQVGAIKELVEQFGRRWDATPFVLLTGGGAPLVASRLPQARCEPHLSLQGLAIAMR